MSKCLKINVTDRDYENGVLQSLENHFIAAVIASGNPQGMALIADVSEVPIKAMYIIPYDDELLKTIGTLFSASVFDLPKKEDLSVIAGILQTAY
ncbi:MAG: hypothetical protein HAW67_04440 [Endozoicomonadaceae bacterium]|nr:hypothetical protein [Endozoicomonadaceae bacterium]